MKDLHLSKNRGKLNYFVKYCNAHPEERFWQALRNWAKVGAVYITKDDKDGFEGELHDTFHDN